MRSYCFCPCKLQVVTVQDDEQAIAEAVRQHSNCNDVVFTSGGIGPTHDVGDNCNFLNCVKY